MNLASFDRIWFLTWTTYGTWLPGDPRGFVSPKFDEDTPERRHNEPGRAYDAGRRSLQRLARNKLVGNPVQLTQENAHVIKNQLKETARVRGWQILAGAILWNHIHLVVGVVGDPDSVSLLRDFKSYASRALNDQFERPKSRTWWTQQGSRRKIRDWENLETVLRYVREQANPIEVWECDDQGKADSHELPGANPKATGKCRSFSQKSAKEFIFPGQAPKTGN